MLELEILVTISIKLDQLVPNYLFLNNYFYYGLGHLIYGGYKLGNSIIIGLIYIMLFFQLLFTQR